jgi:acetolactate decarboxylase
MKMKISTAIHPLRITTIMLLLALTPALHAADKLKALIVDGQNAFHPVWPKSTVMMNPITKGLPDIWAHTKDECYSHLRGPAENLTILATASDSPELKAAGRHEPMLMTVQYHKGRVFHTTLGHDTEAFEGVGFITTFLRGTEWAATGKVTQGIPDDFPTADKKSARPFQLVNKQASGQRDMMTQISTYDALAAGLYDGVAPLSVMLGRGDLGLGTLHGWNGELILLDGKYWLVDGAGAVSRITDMTATTPFLAVTHFDEDVRRPLPNGTTFADLKKSPTNYVPGVNVIYAIKLEGTFRHVKVRSMPTQSKPYKVMAELVKTQPTFEFNEVVGTMIGFWSPASMQGIGLAGWHLHFLTKDEHGGGHVLEFTASDAMLKLDETLEMDWHISGLPDYKNAPLGAKP